LAGVLELKTDILIPAAIGGVIHGENAARIDAKLIVEGANLPITCEADNTLGDRGIPIVPGILANAGGVTVSYLEWVQNRNRYQWDEARVNRDLEKRMRAAWEAMRARAKADGVGYRMAAYLIAVERVKNAIEMRGF